MLIQLTSAFNPMERCKFAKRRVLFKLVQIRNHLELVLIRDQLKISNGLQVSLKNGKNYKDVHKNMETELICVHRLRFKSRISRLINEKKKITEGRKSWPALIKSYIQYDLKGMKFNTNKQKFDPRSLQIKNNHECVNMIDISSHNLSDIHTDLTLSAQTNKSKCEIDLESSKKITDKWNKISEEQKSLKIIRATNLDGNSTGSKNSSTDKSQKTNSNLFYESVKIHKSRMSREKMSFFTVPCYPPVPEATVRCGQARKITTEMFKNRGLTRHRKIKIRNARVKNRTRFEKNKSVEPKKDPLKMLELRPYKGETKAIITNLIKSISMKP
jgi:hypothetical protein